MTPFPPVYANTIMDSVHSTYIEPADIPNILYY